MRSRGIAIVMAAVVCTTAAEARAAIPCPGPELPAAELAGGASEVRAYRADRARMFLPDLMGYRSGPRLGRPSRTERKKIAQALEFRRHFGLNRNRLLIRRLLRDRSARVIEPDIRLTLLERRVVRLQEELSDHADAIQQFMRDCVDGGAGLYLDANRRDGAFVAALVTKEPVATLVALRARYRYADLLRVRVVRYSERQLEAITDAISHDDAMLRRRGIDVRSTSVDTPRNRVEVGLRRPTTATREFVRDRYGEAVYVSPRPTLICTLVGCDSAIGVRMRNLPPGARAVQLCSRGRCVGGRVGRDYPYLSVPTGPCKGGRDRIRSVTFKVFGSGGRRLAVASAVVRLNKNQPNGPECGPTCWQAGLSYDGRRGTLAAGRQASSPSSSPSDTW